MNWVIVIAGAFDSAADRPSPDKKRQCSVMQKRTSQKRERVEKAPQRRGLDGTWGIGGSGRSSQSQQREYP
jgi:hypothetical protein